eukprot:TRINITY_DN298_c0_g1_i1.p1 TRINITY_DN298_c0_g1~~TRINITY_DN298_c0_g1_i1.p1  ORF type:complete len:112 (-),score=1.93 TRINITY_DN298_c0_g1_i1:128-463(-)
MKERHPRLTLRIEFLHYHCQLLSLLVLLNCQLLSLLLARVFQAVRFQLLEPTSARCHQWLLPLIPYEFNLSYKFNNKKFRTIYRGENSAKSKPSKLSSFDSKFIGGRLFFL